MAEAVSDVRFTLETLAAERFGPLYEAERKLLRAAPGGQEANCGPDGIAWDAPENDPAHALNWEQNRILRTALLEWLCIDRKAIEQVHHSGIRVVAARIDDLLDLSFARMPFPLTFVACWWPRGIILRGAALPELHLPRCRISLPSSLVGGVESQNLAIAADGIQVQNSLALGRGFDAEGEVRLRGAKIGGNLDCTAGGFKNGNGPALNMEGAKAGGAVLLRDNFYAEGEMRFFHAELGALQCSGGSRFKNGNGPTLNVEGAKIGGAVYLCDNFQAEGEVRLFGAEVGDRVECVRNSRFENRNRVALNMEGARVGGTVLLRDSFHAGGEVRLLGAEVGGPLECVRNSRFENGNGPALNMEGAKVGGAVLLRDDFHAEGEVRFLRAELALLYCSDSSFKNGNGPALNMALAAIDSGAFFRDGFQADGQVVLSGITIGSDLQIGGDLERGGADLAKGPASGLYLQRGNIKGALDVVGMRTGADTVVNLTDTSCNVLVDASESWPQAGNLVLDGFVYRRVRNPWEPNIRLDWLRRQLPPKKKERRGRFRPQPYRQLAGVLREQGLEAEGRSILIGMVEDRRRWTDLGLLSRGWQWVLWITIRNGHQPLRAGFCLCFLWIIGFLVFGWGYQARVMVPSDHFAYEEFAKGTLPGQYDPFCALVYAIDTSLPIIGFGQKDRWHPRFTPARPRAARSETHGSLYGFFCKARFTRRWDPHSKWIASSTLAQGLEVYRWIHLAFGWFLATMLVAGISGLVGRE